MPPSKYGANLASKTTPPTQKTLDTEFKVVKHVKRRGRKGKGVSEATLKKKDEGLLKLRIPLDICKMLPSVKKFNGSKKIKMKDMPLIKEDSDMDKPQPQTLLGVKRKRGEQGKYHLKLEAEEKFNAMIWDIAFAKDGQVIITTSDGAYISDMKLENTDKLENIILGGGIGLLSDGKIVILCRFMDALNIFTADGSFLKSFNAGFSPQCVLVNESDEILVSDTGKKEVRVYNTNGKVLRTIESKGEGYALKWPLYMAHSTENDIAVTDCHSQQVLIFDKDGKYKKDFSLKTYGGNRVLRPHGLCNNDTDMFIIDCAIDSMEVFESDGTFLQTLLPSDEGINMKPNICKTSPDGHFLLIGGLKGQIRLYRFVSEPTIQEEMEVTLQLKTEPKVGRPFKVKREISAAPVKKRKSESSEVIVLD